MVASIYGAATVVAVLLKGAGREPVRSGPFLLPRSRGYRAGHRRAVVSDLQVSTVHGLLCRGARSTLRLPLFRAGFMATVVTSFLCDDHATAPAEAPGFTRWLEGWTRPAAGRNCIFRVAGIAEHDNSPERFPLGALLLSAALIGLIIGTSVPTWYRAALHRRQADRVAAASAHEAGYERTYVEAQALPAE